MRQDKSMQAVWAAVIVGVSEGQKGCIGTWGGGVERKVQSGGLGYSLPMVPPKPGTSPDLHIENSRTRGVSVSFYFT